MAIPNGDGRAVDFWFLPEAWGMQAGGAAWPAPAYHAAGQPIRAAAALTGTPRDTKASPTLSSTILAGTTAAIQDGRFWAGRCVFTAMAWCTCVPRPRPNNSCDHGRRTHPPRPAASFPIGGARSGSPTGEVASLLLRLCSLHRTSRRLLQNEPEGVSRFHVHLPVQL